jgi:guanylate kinase
VARSQHGNGIFFILVAPAGAGKNRLIEAVVARVKDVHQLPTATTRAMRPGEEQGREHVFVSTEAFEQYVERGALLEHQLVHGVHYYGILREKIELALQRGEVVIADIELKGARAAREAYAENVVTVFVQPPSVSSLVERMRMRKEQDAEIARRLLRAPMELEFAAEADYVVVNDELEHAVTALIAVITAERSRPARQGDEARLHYSFAAQVVPICGAEALRRMASPHYPQVILKEGEPPHVAAARALNQAFGVALPAGEWVYGPTGDDAFLPPLAVQTAATQGHDQIIFVYQYRLAERLNPPNGWEWAAIPTIVEPERSAP